MILLAYYILSLLIVLTFTTLLFFVAQIKKDNSIIDISYGIGFIITAYTLAYFKLSGEPLSPISLLILLLITIWGVRLSYRIYSKNKGKEEDFRYKSWREDWNRRSTAYYYIRSYLQIFVLQGFVISIVLLPFTLSLASASLASVWTLLFFLVWCVGFYFESVGDRQLDRFIRSKRVDKGTIMKTGLWKYTRHPNYFGESTMWFSIALIAISSGTSYLAILSPFLITYLLLYVSGIPMLEKKWEGNTEWEEYKKKTSAFIPLPPQE